MKKPIAKIRQELAVLQEELRQAETRDAERIGRIALKAGLGDVEIEAGHLLAALEEIAARFRTNPKSAHGHKPADTPAAPPANGTGEGAGPFAEA